MGPSGPPLGPKGPRSMGPKGPWFPRPLGPKGPRSMGPKGPWFPGPIWSPGPWSWSHGPSREIFISLAIPNLEARQRSWKNRLHQPGFNESGLSQTGLKKTPWGRRESGNRGRISFYDVFGRGLGRGSAAGDEGEDPLGLVLPRCSDTSRPTRGRRIGPRAYWP